MLTKGMSKEKITLVTEEQTAINMHSGGLHVLATPALIALMALESDQTTVGTLVNIHHIAPTPVGSQVKAVAKLIEIDRKRLVFEVEAFDEQEKIGYGLHERFIVNGASFQEKCNQKRQ